MDTSNTIKQQVSQALDADLSEAQLQTMLKQLRTEERASVVQTWDEYHLIGDVLRSDELDVQLSANFTSKVMAAITDEPAILAPKSVTPPVIDGNSCQVNTLAANSSRYMAITSIAAAVMVAFVMAPQIISAFHAGSTAPAMSAKNEASDAFSSNVRLASNSGKDVSPSEDIANRNEVNQASVSKGSNAKETEFAQKLESQVEMLRDPRLDSYLQAHQKVSPTFDDGARHIQRANVVVEPSEK